MASNSHNDNNTNVNEKIEALWVMGGASVLKDYSTKDIVGYSCYCDSCKKKSVSGEGGIAFNTAEDLLEHRKMKAFICPCGCGFHICEEFGSIIRHLDTFHKEVITKLQKEGLNLEERKKVWIYPDQAENTFTLTKPLPIFDGSPLENAAVILSMTPPKRIDTQSKASMGPKKKGKYVPLDLNKPVNKPETVDMKQSETVDVDTKQSETVNVETEAKVELTPPKKWAPVSKQQIKSLSTVMEEETVKKDMKKQIQKEVQKVQKDNSIWGVVHYAQFDMRKEKQCPEGQNCVKKDRPFACPLNHDGMGEIIKRGTVLTEKNICPYERPCPDNNGMRCGDGRCTRIHLEHRAEFIEKKKKMFFENDTHVKSGISVGSVVSELAKKKVSARIKTTANGGTIEMSEEDIRAIASLGPDVFDIEAQKNALEEFEFDKPHSAFPPDINSDKQDTSDEEEDDEDTIDIKVFAARQKKLIRNAEL